MAPLRMMSTIGGPYACVVPSANTSTAPECPAILLRTVCGAREAPGAARQLQGTHTRMCYPHAARSANGGAPRRSCGRRANRRLRPGCSTTPPACAPPGSPTRCLPARCARGARVSAARATPPGMPRLALVWLPGARRAGARGAPQPPRARRALTTAKSLYGAATCSIGQSNQLKWFATQTEGAFAGGALPCTRTVTPIHHANTCHSGSISAMRPVKEVSSAQNDIGMKMNRV